MKREISFEIPTNIKFEDYPELFAEFIRQIEEHGLGQHHSDEFLALFVEALRKNRSAALAARELVRIYWRPGPHPASLAGLRNWLANKPSFDTNQEVFFIQSLIELAGRRALKEGVSKRASNAAKSKNAKPREWVRSEWASRSDRGQSKASFSRQYASLVKKQFGVDVTPEQISRVWLPKG